MKFRRTFYRYGSDIVWLLDRDKLIDPDDPTPLSNMVDAVSARTNCMVASFPKTAFTYDENAILSGVDPKYGTLQRLDYE